MGSMWGQFEVDIGSMWWRENENEIKMGKLIIVFCAKKS